MTSNKYEFENDVCCSPQWVSDDDYPNEHGPCSDKRKILINAPPSNGRCMICGRRINELDAFGGPGDPCLGDFVGAKLIKMWREDYPGYTRPTWECRDCVARPGPVWAIDEETRLGRPLTQREYIGLRHKLELSLVTLHEDASSPKSKR